MRELTEHLHSPRIAVSAISLGGSVVESKNQVWSGRSFSENGRVHVLKCPKLQPSFK